MQLLEEEGPEVTGYMSFTCKRAFPVPKDTSCVKT